MPGRDVFHLFDTSGIPVELTREWAAAQGLTLDESGYEAALAEHREISGSGAGKYAGGLVSRDQTSIRLHTATHLLHQALREVLGPHVAQKGSHITPERLRFDFSHPTAMSQAEIEAVERRVNEQIEADLPVHQAEMSLQAAQAQGAIGLFEEKYGDQVKVYSIGDYSQEICGGPHVERTGELGRFHIAREQSSGAGIRRIRATIEGEPT
jgi:alanyl-tRNA synthetase